DPLHRPEESELVPFELFHEGGGGVHRNPEERPLQLLEGWAPGSISTTNHRSELGRSPLRPAGTRPARARQAFPRPDSPTTARNLDPGPDMARTSCSVTASRPKKSAASASRNGRSPLNGFLASTPVGARRGPRPSASRSARAIACGSE